jgi:hypothetical protein
MVLAWRVVSGEAAPDSGNPREHPVTPASMPTASSEQMNPDDSIERMNPSDP